MAIIKKMISFGKNSKNFAVIELDDNTRQRITYRDLKKYWEYANYKSIEVADYSIIESYLVIWATVASGQGGRIAIWDCNKSDWCHIQEGSFTIAAILLPKYGMVISLHYVMHYGVSAHHKIWAAKLGNLDTWPDYGAEITVAWQQRPFNYLEYDISQAVILRNADQEILKEFGDAGLFYSQKNGVIYAHDAGNYAEISVREIYAKCEGSGEMDRKSVENNS